MSKSSAGIAPNAEIKADSEERTRVPSGSRKQLLSRGPINNQGGGYQVTEDSRIGRHLIVVGIVIVVGLVQPTAQNGAVGVEGLHRRLDRRRHPRIIGIDLWLGKEGHRGAHEGSRTIHVVEPKAPGSDRDNVVAAIVAAFCLADHRAHTHRVKVGVCCRRVARRWVVRPNTRGGLLRRQGVRFPKGDDAELSFVLGLVEQFLHHHPIPRLENVKREDQAGHERCCERKERQGLIHPSSVDSVGCCVSSTCVNRRPTRGRLSRAPRWI